MPVTPTYPGVYIEEIPSGVRTITGVATSITAFIGRTLKGPVNEPTLINNWGDFTSQFGDLHVDYPMSYSVRDFYNNGGAQALIVRLYKPKEQGKDGIAKFDASPLPALTAASPGQWANSLKVQITPNEDVEVADRYDFTEANALFDLSVFEAGKENLPPLERIRNVSIKEGLRRVDRVLEKESQYLRLSQLPLNPPAKGLFEPTTKGEDSDFLTNSSDYEGDQDNKTGLYALEKADLFNLLCIPPDKRGGDTPKTVYSKAMTYCAKRRAMLIVDAPAAWGANKETAANTAKKSLGDLVLNGPDARNAALYFPRVIQADPLREDQLDTFVPCGMIAGVMARTDVQRGIWKAPAGIDAALNGISGLQVNLSDDENGLLNPLGINCLRNFRVYGNVVWGARTLRGADQMADEYKYVPVRRLVLYLEESLYRGTQWVVFEPNDEPLWAQIRLNIGVFMNDLFRQGAFQGKSPKDAYFVKCDSETTTQSDIDRGIVNIVVGFAPLKPAEFVIIKIQQISKLTPS